MRHSTATMSRVRRAGLSGVAAVAAIALAACQGPAGTGGGDRQMAADQTLKLGLSTEPPPLITGAQQGAVASTLATLIHRGLMAYDSSGKLTTGLAASYKQSTDKSYVFTLRDGLTFSDGTPLTSDNVKRSLEYYADPSSSSVVYAGLKDIRSIVASGNKVTVGLAAPNTAFLQYLAAPMAAIVPDSALNPKTPNLVGAGPFKIDSKKPGVGMVLKKFDGYYGAPGVTLTEIDVAYYPDSQARTNALLSGDVEMIDYVPVENSDSIARAPGLVLASENGPYGAITFNVTKPPFNSPLVRQAVAMAINRAEAVKAVYHGQGAPLDTVVISQTDAAYNPEKQELFGYHPDKAKALLAQAGYPDGFSSTILATSQYSFLQDTALTVQAELAKVGIKLTLDAPDWPTAVQKNTAGDYGLASIGEAGVVTDPSYVAQMIDGSTYWHKSFGYKNQNLNALIDEGLRTSDPAKRKAIYGEFLTEFAQDVPFVPLNLRPQAWAFQDTVTGFKVFPGFLSLFSGYSLVDTKILED